MKQKTKVLVGVLSGGNMATVSLLALFADLPFMSADKDNDYVFLPTVVSGIRPQEYARNILCQQALEHDADILVMVDDDMIFRNGSRSLVQLLDTPEWDIIAPLQLMFRIDGEQGDGKAGPHIYPCAMELDSSQPVGKQAYVVWPVEGKEVTPVDAVGSGVIAIRRRVLDSPQMELQAGMTPPALWRNVYEANGHRIRGLDVDFCARAKDLGYRVKVNWSVPTGHYKRIDLYEAEVYAKNQFLYGHQTGKASDGIPMDQGEGGQDGRPCGDVEPVQPGHASVA